MTEKYVSEIIQEAVKNSLKKQALSLNEQEIRKLEKKIRSLSEEEKINLFSDSKEEVAKSITKDQIKTEELFENVKLAINNTFGNQVRSLLSGLSMAVKDLTKEVTEKYVSEIIQEAVKNSLKKQTLSLNEKEIRKLEKKIRSLSEEEKIDLFSDSKEEVAKSVTKDQIKTEELFENVKLAVNNTFGNQVRSLLSGLSMAVKVALVAAAVLFITIAALPDTPEPVLAITPDPLAHDFGEIIQGEAAFWQFSIRNEGEGILHWEADSDQSWMTIYPRQGTESDYITVQVDTAHLEPRHYRGTFEIRSNGGNRAGNVDLTVIQGPVLSISESPFYHDFGQVILGDSASWQFSIENAGSGTLEWEIHSDQPWITINPRIGVNSHDILVEVRTDDLDENFYRGNIIINSNDRSETGNIVMNVISRILFGPDLIVSRFEIGSPIINSENSVEVPIRVDIKNQGDINAEIFKIAAIYSGSSGTNTIPFTVEGQDDIWYPYTSAPLRPDDSVVFEGIITFPPSLHYEAVTVWAIADSCSGDEFMPPYCRVDESNELNNNAQSLPVYLPGEPG